MSIKTDTETGSHTEGHTGTQQRGASTGLGANGELPCYVSVSRADHCWSPNIANLKDTKEKKKKALTPIGTKIETLKSPVVLCRLRRTLSPHL